MKKVIAISGLPCSGSTTTAKLLSKKLSLNFFTIGQVWKDISRGNVKEKFYYSIFRELCDKNDLLIPEFNAENDSHGASFLWGTDFGKSKEFNNALDELQLNLAKEGNIVIEGKLSLHIVPEAEKKIWLKADIDKRAKRASQRDGIHPTEAERLLSDRIKSQEEGWQKVYGFNYLDLEQKADIVIDTSNLTPEQVVEKILEELK
ncbi:MAG: (d)CMP kinase [Nanoarchaeota archaeon]|nr:(d)CMP kinase [Nanoarchaeota archaeon]